MYRDPKWSGGLFLLRFQTYPFRTSVCHSPWLRKVHLQPLVDKVSATIPTWKAQLMNKAGRLTMVEVVMSAKCTHGMIAWKTPDWVNHDCQMHLYYNFTSTLSYSTCSMKRQQFSTTWSTGKPRNKIYQRKKVKEVKPWNTCTRLWCTRNCTQFPTPSNCTAAGKPTNIESY
jgi:hypothetical protein